MSQIERYHYAMNWLEQGDILNAVASLDSQLDCRKLYLFAAACLSNTHPELPRHIQISIQHVERFLNGELTHRKFVERIQKNSDARSPLRWLPRCLCEPSSTAVAEAACHWSCVYLGRSPVTFNWRQFLTRNPHASMRIEEVDCSRLIPQFSDILGNPFHPVAFSPAWRTSTAIGIASTMYDSRNFNAMPILADALQDAGCEEESILAHCREEKQVHVRGCWVVDLVLGKK